MATLIIPLVSTGNVSQLCVDLILHSSSEKFQFVKDLNSIWLHPFLGPLDYVAGSNTPLYHGCNEVEKQYTTPLELFFNKSASLYVIQQRSPIINGYENQFFKDVIIPLIQELQIASVIVLDSAGALDCTIPISNSHYQSQFAEATCQIEPIEEMTRQFQTHLQLENQSQSHVNKSFKFNEDSFQESFSVDQPVYKLLYHLLYHSRLPLKSIKYLSKIVHEGDNSWDALQVCGKLGELLPSLNTTQLVSPISWKGVYGARPIASGFDQGIYS